MEEGASNISTFVFWGLIAAAVVYAVVIYNNLVSLKHAVSKAWSNIDVLLKQRHDELPKLVETCRQYKDFEQETLEKVMQARADAQNARQRGDVKGVGQAESAMRLGLGNLFAVAEAYPELKADQAFQQLQGRITGLENSIADRREFYNESVNLNNVRIEQFPDVIIARMLGFKSADLLEFSQSETADVNIRSLFSS
ncbi:LemA [Oceanococcus atlanticus]|uniref:LemA n=1 Tax=Oceanococcus atlanticus TaxID=1317117 RepID=A0A1Y1SAJ7_9GAMM|nr:LemA family protein [Oceanococcus atlanticus]ORE85437.1 LemA [Oceanococcus atlanticus]RZO84576.1 MAG: LemA family protein [Oceanococcus sp.]